MRTSLVSALRLSTDPSRRQRRACAIAAVLIAAAGAAWPSRAAEDGGVLYFDHQRVTAAFATGAVLFDGHGTNYMVHASRRDAAGRVEVHTRDTDIIYVLSGSATFVTGGTVIDPQTIANDEIRGTTISGGDARQLQQGDVIVVPAGTAHWFKDVPAPMTYYVVKVRGA